MVKLAKRKGKQKVKTKQTTVSKLLYELFKNHIGLESGLTQEEILIKIFGRGKSFLESYYDWRNSILPSMHRLRKTTRMFIVSGKLHEKFIFFVMKRPQEQYEYEERLTKDKKGIEKSIQRSKKALRERWHLKL